MGHRGALQQLLLPLLLPLTCFHIWGAAGGSPPTSDKPPPPQFRCSDGLCLPKLSVCDGRADCADGSDERRCGHPCGKDEFACPGARCIPLRLLCDGVDNCGDGSDEAPCRSCAAPSRPRPPDPSACSPSEFRCGDGQCVSRSWRCDHSPDCADGSDEEDCDEDECKVNKGGCSHGCKDLPMGFYCYCPDNMKLIRDSHCEEIDACLESDACDQLCVDASGNLTCDCREDYRMNPTTGECRAKGGAAQLAFTSSKGVRWINLTGADHREPARRLAGPGPLAAMVSDRTLYWARQGRGSIYRVPMDETPRDGTPRDSAPVLKVQGPVSGLALDWIHRLLYWTAAESGSLSVGLLDGSAQRRLIKGLDQPSAVAVEPLQGLLFWAQCGSAPKIERARLNGQDRRALVSYSIRHPVALSLDMPRQLLYWVDQGTKSISRVNLEGRHRKTVVESNGYLDRPFGLAVFEGFVYWSEEVTRSVCRASKHDGRGLRVLLSNASSPGGVVVVQPALQPNGPAVCGDTRTVCRHECLVDLLADGPEFRCAPPETGRTKSQDIPSISRTAPPASSSLSDPTFVGILSLIMFLSVLLAGMALWWWREALRPPRPIAEQTFSLKESQDPLISQAPPETLLKLDPEGE